MATVPPTTWATSPKETRWSTSSFLLSGSYFSVTLAEGSVAVHQSHFQMTVGSQLLFEDIVLLGEHLADFHKGFVLGLRNDEDGVDGHSKADGAKDQVTVRTCSNLKWEDIQCNCDSKNAYTWSEKKTFFTKWEKSKAGLRRKMWSHSDFYPPY